MRIVHLFITLSLALFVAAQDVQAQPPGQNTSPEEYIALWKDVAVKKMTEHGIPASITLAQGLLESRNGNSVLATEGNNHFGIKCTPDWTGGKMYHDDDRKNDCFRKYKQAAQSFEDHSKFLQRPRYAELFELKPTDYKGWAKGLKKCGYATDPRYPQKLIDLIERYELYKLDEGQDVTYARKDPPKENAKPARKPSRTSNAEVITIGAGREIEKFDGRIKFVRAKKGDNIRKVAADIEQMPGLVAGWNDLSKDASLEEGQIVYIQPKRNKSTSPEVHVAEEGETLWGISQRYGVKLKKLAKYNAMGIADPVRAGQKVWLRKPRN
ncbi:MAG TPA: glucosaminidase domain-containing protein, partial [Flavobacteriales bacterium]|jgi:nucleoid-associated protein YgaU|nr:glucosaminidase domain-containing protein [Flavobacteriales bacterium]